MKTPESVLTFARKRGYNSANYAGKIGKDKYYGLCILDEHGIPFPMGLPFFAKETPSGEIQEISGKEALNIIDLIDDSDYSAE